MGNSPQQIRRVQCIIYLTLIGNKSTPIFALLNAWATPPPPAPTQAEDKASRDAFRRFMAAQPDRWDFGTAGVPSPLTDEMEEAQAAKKVCS